MWKPRLAVEESDKSLGGELGGAESGSWEKEEHMEHVHM